MKRVILVFSLFISCILNMQAQEEEYCNTLKWKVIRTIYTNFDGSSFQKIGDLDGAIINMDTLPEFYPGIYMVNTSKDTFFENERFIVLVGLSTYSDTGFMGAFNWEYVYYYFSKDYFPNDTLNLGVRLKVDLEFVISQVKENSGIELEEISYWEMIIGVLYTSKDGDYSDSVFFASADTATFRIVRGDVGIAETDNSPSLRVYPNPVNNELRVTSYEGGEIQIYDVVGRRLTNFQFSTFNSQSTIDVSHLAKGMYFLRVGDRTTKFIKE